MNPHAYEHPLVAEAAAMLATLADPYLRAQRDQLRELWAVLKAKRGSRR